MTTFKAMAIATSCLLLIILSFSIQAYGCIMPLLIIGLVCGGIGYHKYSRDQQIIAQAYREQESAAHQLPALPPMTSPGSSRLFVPPPLQHNDH